ncbi:hypothetical protein [Sulfitobacter sabulilitoris]|uniref:Uncharacterized protein n=1 Tax=Sulfitobacter sabulilitoris TaxID=2562655 RepID=A0A5S3PID2_9RHOB|nr:hypothetical protein [Sulfitobacter sabulilitoris]TMM51705.1 hypothetical protein FDT80_13210 [Sulfitobacter sabulilitoris]
MTQKPKTRRHVPGWMILIALFGLVALAGWLMLGVRDITGHKSARAAAANGEPWAVVARPQPIGPAARPGAVVCNGPCAACRTGAA